MDTVERLKMLINQLCFGKNAEFARQLGITPQVLNNWFKRGLSKDAVEKIGKRWLNININWLLTGKGEMFLSITNVNVDKVNNDNIEQVPVRFFAVRPSATFQEFYSGVEEESDYMNITPLPYEDLDDSYCVFEVYGESMAPQIQPKSQVLCHEISPTRWHMLRNCIIVIAYADRFVIKRIYKNYLDAHNILILESDNPDFPEKEQVQLSDIRCIFKAERIISQKIF